MPLGNVIQITPTNVSDQVERGARFGAVLSNRGEVVAVVIRDAEPAAKPSDVAFVGAPAQDPPAGKQITDFAGL